MILKRMACSHLATRVDKGSMMNALEEVRNNNNNKNK